MSKELLVKVLTKELKIGLGVATDIADACTPEQLEAVTGYLQSISQGPHRHYIDNWDKYAIMMMTAFRNADTPSKPQYKPKLKPVRTFQKATNTVKEVHMDKIREFLNE